jgi:hypothetical protein
MTPKTLLRISILVLCLSSIQALCRKDVKKGTTISANGFVIDSAVNQRIPGATVYLVGGKQGYYGMEYGPSALDSTSTDAQGSFSLSYVAQGNYTDYALCLENFGVPFRPLHGTYIRTESPTYYPFNFVHQLTDQPLTAWKLGQATYTLRVDSNPYDTLLLRVFNEGVGFESDYAFFGSHIDTTFQLPYFPYSQNYIWYRILVSSLQDSSTRFTRFALDSIRPGIVNSFVFSQIYSSAYDIPLAPF